MTQIEDRLEIDGGALSLRLTNVQATGNALLIEYTIQAPTLTSRQIVQPVIVPVGETRVALPYCVQQITDGVLPPLLRAIGHEVNGDDVSVFKVTSSTEGQEPIEWDVFVGPALAYDQGDGTSREAATALNDNLALFKIVFSNMAFLMETPDLHWWKVFYARMPNGQIIGDLWYDEYSSEATFAAVKGIKLPKAPFLMFRQFGVLRPVNRPIDTARLRLAQERYGVRPEPVEQGPGA
jgi:Family of unknown function (DUF6348)